MNESALAKAVALVLWADDNIDQTEMKAASKIYEHFGLDWGQGKALLESQIGTFLDTDEDNEGEEEYAIGTIDFGEGVDTLDVLSALADLACADGKVAFSEVQILHEIGRAMNVSVEIVTIAILLGVQSAKAKVDVEIQL